MLAYHGNTTQGVNLLPLYNGLSKVEVSMVAKKQYIVHSIDGPNKWRNSLRWQEARLEDWMNERYVDGYEIAGFAGRSTSMPSGTYSYYTVVMKLRDDQS